MRDGFGITRRILGCAIEVHKSLGPGLLESAYRKFLVHELQLNGLRVRQEVPIPVSYKGAALDVGFRADVIIEELVLVEIKAVEQLLPVHDAQLLTYLKLTDLTVGLLLNFNCAALRQGIRRIAR